MHQLALILPAPGARRRDPSTSRDAARKATTFANNHRDRILAALATPGNIYEIAQRCGLDHVACARRLPELLKLGLAEPTEERRQGCRVWRRT